MKWGDIKSTMDNVNIIGHINFNSQQDVSKKYELTDDCIEIDDHKLYRIKALRTFGDVTEGNLGGYIEKEDNLAHDGTCWVYNDAKVYGNAKVCDSAKVRKKSIVVDACICGATSIHDNAKIYGNAKISGNAIICDNVKIFGCCKIFDNAIICDNAFINGSNVFIYGQATIRDNVSICDNVSIYDCAIVCGDAILCGYVRVFEHAYVCGNIKLSDHTSLGGNAYVKNNHDVLYFKGFDSEFSNITFFRTSSQFINVIKTFLLSNVFLVK